MPSGGSSTVGSAKQCITATTAWTSFPAVNYTTKTAGDSLTIDVIDAAPSANASFDLDNVSLTTGTGGGDVTAPTVPQHVSALGDSSTTVSVTWDASTDNTAVTGYNVYRGTTLVKTTGATVTSFEDSGLTSSTTYSYSVNAFDAGGNTSANSTAVSATTLAGGGGGDITAPSIPQNVSAAGDSPSTVAMTWNASSDNTAVTGYNVYRGTVLVKTTGATATSFEDSGLTASTTYSYTVTAFDAAGNTSAPLGGRHRHDAFGRWRFGHGSVRNAPGVDGAVQTRRGVHGGEPHVLGFLGRFRRP